jgi:hypothetical protein
MGEQKTITIAGASQTWPEFRILLEDLHDIGGFRRARYEIKVSSGDDWIPVTRDVYRDALATSRLSAVQEINGNLGMLLDLVRERGAR